MRLRHAGIGVAAALAGLMLFGCGDEEGSSKDVPPATVLEVAGSDTKEVMLTEAAARRLGIEMGAVAEEAGDVVIPYAAVVYDEEGATWAYISPAPLTFVRTPITVSRIVDDLAFITEGPEIGTEVVTVGQAELYGTEQGIGY